MNWSKNTQKIKLNKKTGPQTQNKPLPGEKELSSKIIFQ